ncbi:MAG: hypothetical protein HN850_08320 [Lentimicrobiaceae bacterium]|nr:hypothetical protein [Lentimicrobiaceae bacterium]MBT7317203.1 hypothetical protein [Lentimicrobiaceae bacterium]
MKVTTKIKDGKTYIRVRFKRLVPIYGDQYGYQNSMGREFTIHTGLKLTKENSAIITQTQNITGLFELGIRIVLTVYLTRFRNGELGILEQLT